MLATSHDRKMVGFTLIEVIVVMLVVALLVALLIPAVQYARETSRKLSCANHLKQLGLALNAYEASFRVYPQGANGGFFSAELMILPFLEQTSLYNSTNFVTEEGFGGFANGGSNQTISQTRLNVLVCPSEPNSQFNYTTNYGWNGGFGMQLKDFVGVFRSGAVPILNYIGTSSVTDGLSNTAAASEWRIGAINSDDDSTIVYRVEIANGEDYSKFIQDCLAATRANTAFGSWTKNAQWYVGSYGSTILNFNSNPGSHNCWYDMSFDYGNWPIGSYHAAGANMVFLDGHVQFMKNSVSLPLLQALATKSGGENIQY